MSFSKDAQFRINVAKKSFGSNFKNFKELIKEFTKSSIIEDITEIPLGKNSQFKEQFDFFSIHSFFKRIFLYYSSNK